MGYESSGYGTFILRKPISEELLSELRDYGFDIQSLNDIDKYDISFNSFHISSSGEEMKKIADNFNGEFKITGEEEGDVWKMIFKDGIVYTSEGTIIYSEDIKEIDLSSSDWN